jgi:hypothetical protein
MASEIQSQSPQEIDLLQLFQKMGEGIKNFFVWLFRGMLFLIIFGIRKIHFILLFAVAGALIGYVLFSNTQRYYSSYMVAQPNGISSADMINYINDLHDLCKKKNSQALAYDLQMADTTARKIKDIQAFFIIDINKDGVGDYVDFKNAFSPRDTTMARLEDRIHVTVEVYDNTAFENVKRGLYRYMNKNPYLIKLNEIRKNELQELIAQTQHEIQKLDSLQNTDYFQSNTRASQNSSQLMILAEKEPTMYYRDKLSLTIRKQEYQKELELATDAFAVIKDFTNLAMAENPKSKYMTRYGVIFGILGFILLLLGVYRKEIMLRANNPI